MILDNQNENLKVHEWISKCTLSGNLSIVTGYFTIGALAFLSKQTRNKIEKFRFVLGDIVNFDMEKDRALDLLNENITKQKILERFIHLQVSSIHQKPALHLLLLPAEKYRAILQW